MPTQQTKMTPNRWQNYFWKKGIGYRVTFDHGYDKKKITLYMFEKYCTI